MSHQLEFPCRIHGKITDWTGKVARIDRQFDGYDPHESLERAEREFNRSPDPFRFLGAFLLVQTPIGEYEVIVKSAGRGQPLRLERRNKVPVTSKFRPNF
jgi:hypothetical protein